MLCRAQPIKKRARRYRVWFLAWTCSNLAHPVAAGIAAFLLGFAKGKGMDDAIGKQAVFRALAFPILNDHCLYLVAWILEYGRRIYP